MAGLGPRVLAEVTGVALTAPTAVAAGPLHVGIGVVVAGAAVAAQRALDQARGRGDALCRERDRLREFEARALMVRGAAHDLKNLCVPLVVASDLLSESDMERDQLGSYIQSAADHATALLERLLQAEVDGHHQPTTCMGGQELRRLAPLLRGALERRGHTLEVDLDATAQVHLDRLDLAQCLVNLVTNAGLAGEAPVHVQVRSFIDGGSWCVQVQDDAGGLPDSVRARLFCEGVSERPGGTGIGLALTRHLVERNGGRVEVHTSGEGTCFTLRFPLRRVVS